MRLAHTCGGYLVTQPKRKSVGESALCLRLQLRCKSVIKRGAALCPAPRKVRVGSRGKAIPKLSLVLRGRRLTRLAVASQPNGTQARASLPVLRLRDPAQGPFVWDMEWQSPVAKAVVSVLAL